MENADTLLSNVYGVNKPEVPHPHKKTDRINPALISNLFVYFTPLEISSV